MPTLEATNGSPAIGAPSPERRTRPIGSKRSVANETEDQTNANWFSARLASAFQVACRTAAHTTRAMAEPFTARSYRTSGDGMPENPSIDRGLPIRLHFLTHDYRPDAPCEAVRRRVLPGRTFGQRYRPLGEVRGPRLHRGSPERAGEEIADESLACQLGLAREADRRERDRLPAAGHPPQDRRAGGLLQGVQGRRYAARDPRRGHHHLREALHLHPGRGAPRPRAAADPRRARRAPRARRPAPPARPPRAEPRGRNHLHRGARRPLRLARRPADRRALRDDQRQTHAPEPVAHHQPR